MSPTFTPTLSSTESINVTTLNPTLNPTMGPSFSPTFSPTSNPTISTLTDEPTKQPTLSPTFTPTLNPTESVTTLNPTLYPSKSPSFSPTAKPESTESPTSQCPGKEGTIVDIAVGDPDFSILVQALTAAGLVDALKGPGPLTVFAPPNNAFLSLPPGLLESLLLPENKQLLTDILLYHVVPDYYQRNDFISGDLMTLNGKPVVIEVSGTGIKVNDASIIIPNTEACNGIIQVIDKVLVPPGVLSASPTSTPTAATTTSPPTSATTSPPTSPTTSLPTSNVTVGGIISTDADFSILYQALVAADLMTYVNGPEIHTAFGPPNNAFLSLPNGTLESLLLPQNKPQLQTILLYHIVTPRITSTEFQSRKYVTKSTASVDVVVANGQVKVNTATVIKADIMASNGVIHVIDQVLLPPTPAPVTPTPKPATTTTAKPVTLVPPVTTGPSTNTSFDDNAKFTCTETPLGYSPKKGTGCQQYVYCADGLPKSEYNCAYSTLYSGKKGTPIPGLCDFTGNVVCDDNDGALIETYDDAVVKIEERDEKKKTNKNDRRFDDNKKKKKKEERRRL